MQGHGQGDGNAKTLSESEAVQAMWTHYRQNKGLYEPDLQKHRTKIVDELMQGASIAQAFKRYLLKAEPKPVRPRKPRQVADAKTAKAVRAPWPF